MKALTVHVKESEGRILSSTIFKPGGKRLLSKGHVINDDDVWLLETEGWDQVCVTELEEGEVGEDDAVMMVAKELGCGAIEIRLASGGRANLNATEPSCVLVDDDLLKQINATASVAIATGLNFSYVRAGQRIASVKSAPFAVAKSQLDAVLSILTERGPILQARPIRSPAIGGRYTDPVSGDRARQLFDNIMRQRLERLDVTSCLVLTAPEDEEFIARSLQQLFRAKPTVILVAFTTS